MFKNFFYRDGYKKYTAYKFVIVYSTVIDLSPGKETVLLHHIVK